MKWGLAKNSEEYKRLQHKHHENFITMSRLKVLLIGGSKNQTTMMHEISKHLADSCDCYFSPTYTDGFLDLMEKGGLLEHTIIGKKFRNRNLAYFADHGLQADYRGEKHD